MVKKLNIYYLVHIALNVILVIAFRNSLNITALSVLPLFLIVLMFFQIALFKPKNYDFTCDTAYSVGDVVRLTQEEQVKQYSYLKCAFLLCVPFELPLVLFLPTYWKLLGVIPYILAYIIGAIVFKAKMGKQIQSRIEAEKRNLEEQIKKEELGLK